MKAKKTILVVDDEVNIRRILQAYFEKAGYEVAVAPCASAALQMLSERAFDCVLSDVTMPGMTGSELLKEVHSRWPQMPMVLMTAFGTIPQAVQAIRDGAAEYVTKPFDLDALKRIITGAVRPAAGSGLKSGSKGSLNTKAFIAADPAMKEVEEVATRAADSRATVMIGGESGVGKEVIARLLHERSSRASGPFVAVSCAALPETLLESELFGYEKGAFTGASADKVGRFEAASGGTLFLDEVGEIPLSIQVKLLRALQERQIERLGSSQPVAVDVRVITATHRDLQKAVEDGTFRLDLLYRLQVIELAVPALRDRPGDMEPLAAHFLAKYGPENGKPNLSLSSAALAALKAYAWPGNVRELENAIERAVVMADPNTTSIGPELLPKNIRAA